MSGQHENARADDAADAYADQIERRQGPPRRSRFVVALALSRLVRELRGGLARPIICQKTGILSDRTRHHSSSDGEIGIYRLPQLLNSFARFTPNNNAP